MVICHFLRSSLRRNTQGNLWNNVGTYRSLQRDLFKISLLTRCNNSSQLFVQRDFSTHKGFKGNGMLAPFYDGCQSPLIIEKSEGSYVYDSNGKRYLDSSAGMLCTALGGNEPRLIAAAMEQLNTLPFFHSFSNCTTKPTLVLAEELLGMFTANKMAKVFFTNSGSEANETQVKLVWYYNNALGRPEKKKFIALSKSYHGSTFISASLSGIPSMHQKSDLPAPFVLHTDCPHYWRFHLPGESEEEFSTRLANNLETLILKEGPETIAAFIAEPVLGSAGVILPPATYFDKIQAVLKKYDILFIADEVICGFGRLGTMFGCDKYNIKPDLVSLAKALSSSYVPIGAVLLSPEIADVINSVGSFSHGFTHSGHPLCCAVAIEALKIYKERNTLEKVNSIATRFQEGLKAFSNSPIIGEIRGTGLILGTEFTDNKSPNEPFPPEWEIDAYFGAQCEKHGMLLVIDDGQILICPPFTMTPDETEELISIFGKALKATEERVQELKSQKK